MKVWHLYFFRFIWFVIGGLKVRLVLRSIIRGKSASKEHLEVVAPNSYIRDVHA